MKTDQLITLLANGVSVVDGRQARWHSAMMLGCGALGTVLLMVMWLGVRRDLADAALLPMFWAKLAFAATLLVGAYTVALRLSRPDMRVGHAPLALAVPVLMIWLLAAVALMTAAPESRSNLLLGVSWQVCPINIALLSLPSFIAALWVMRSLAPVRPALAGAASGLFAGALGALAYSFYCPELAAPFIGIWYLLGMLIPALVGGMIGSWLLRW